jgi:hypothetical protein
MTAPTQKKHCYSDGGYQKALKNSSLGVSCFMGSYVMATSVTIFKVKQSKEWRLGPFDNVGGSQTLR